jgi:hypothetical protein
MKPGHKESLLKDHGIFISPQPTKYNTGLKIKVMKQGKQVTGPDKTYTEKECYTQIDIIKEFYYEKLIKLKL